MKKELPISVVATTYNNADEIIGFLQNIVEQSISVAEVVVSDGGSKDDTVKLIEEYSVSAPISIVVRYGKRLNIAEGYNDAIQNTKSSVICILGVGNKFPCSFIEDLYNAFLQHDADVMCPYICGQNNGEFSMAYNKVYLNDNHGADGSNAPNHGCIAKKQVFYELGFFYEKFIYAGEDAEFFTLAKKNGYKIMSDSHILLYWDTPHDWKQLKKQINVYTIADEQWVPLDKIIWAQKKNILMLVILLSSIVFLLLHETRMIGMIGLGLFLIRHILWLSCYGIRGANIQTARQYYKLFCYIKNIKFSQNKYAVKR